MVPKLSAPLTKLIRTTEGWLVVAFNAVIAAAAVFGSLPGVQALKWGGIVTTATVISRQGLKAVAAAVRYDPALSPIDPNLPPQFRNLEGLSESDFGAVPPTDAEELAGQPGEELAPTFNRQPFRNDPTVSPPGAVIGAPGNAPFDQGGAS